MFLKVGKTVEYSGMTDKLIQREIKFLFDCTNWDT